MPLGSPAVHTHSAKVGTCPHGLPLGACPICNGMAGGNSTSKRDTPRNVGEMTYNQCAAIGAMLKAQKQARAQLQASQQNRIQALAEFQKNIMNTHQRLMIFSQMISNTMPPLISRPVNFVLNNIIGGALAFVKNVPTVFVNITNFVNQKITDISDKLAAIYGEAKLAVEEKFSKFLSNIKKKVKSLFFVFGTSETDDEDKKIEEAKRTFELKTLIHKLQEKFQQKEKKDIDNDVC